MATVNIVSIFTRGARSSDTAELRSARAQADVRRANEVWGTGFPPGVSCEINFVLFREFYRPEITIDAGTVTTGVADPRIAALINETRAQLNNATAIYVVYLSGETFSGGAVGNAGPYFENFVNTSTNYTLFGRAALSDGAFETYLLAHEVGHVLFGRFLSDDIDSFTVNDPSNPGDAHNNNPQNIMFPFVPSMNPFINSAQCTTARQSKVVLENAVSVSSVLSGGMGSTIQASGFANGFDDEESFNFEESSDSHTSHKHYHHNKHRFNAVRFLNRKVDCLVQKIGPDKLHIYPKVPKKMKLDCDK